MECSSASRRASPRSGNNPRAGSRPVPPRHSPDPNPEDRRPFQVAQRATVAIPCAVPACFRGCWRVGWVGVERAGVRLAGVDAVGVGVAGLVTPPFGRNRPAGTFSLADRPRGRAAGVVAGGLVLGGVAWASGTVGTGGGAGDAGRRADGYGVPDALAGCVADGRDEPAAGVAVRDADGGVARRGRLERGFGDESAGRQFLRLHGGVVEQGFVDGPGRGRRRAGRRRRPGRGDRARDAGNGTGQGNGTATAGADVVTATAGACTAASAAARAAAAWRAGRCHSGRVSMSFTPAGR